MKDQIKHSLSDSPTALKRGLQTYQDSSSTIPVKHRDGPGNADQTKDSRSTADVQRLGADPLEFVCGWGAASINVVMTFPLNKVMFRQQLAGISTREAIMELAKEGKFRLYRGMLPPLIQKTTCLSVMFGMYDGYQRILFNNFSETSLLVNKGAAAILAGCTEAILTPLERIQTLLQDKYYHKRLKNTVHAFSELRTYGLAEYYRGLTPILMRNGPSNAMFFLLRGEIKKFLPQSETNSGEIVRNFVSGGFLGAMISTLFFPVNVVKTHMQSKLGGEFISFRAALWIVYEERGRSWRAMFRGVHVNYTRSLISWGVINAAYEVLKKYLVYDQV